MSRIISKSDNFDKQLNQVLQKYPHLAKRILKSYLDVYDCLANAKIIPTKYKNHKVGNYWECHLCNRVSDILLIYDKYREGDNIVIELIIITDHDKLNRQIRSSLFNLDLDSLERYLNELDDHEFNCVVAIIERRLKHRI